MTEIEDLSFPAIGIYTLFQDGYEPDSIHTREVFYQGFPEDDYEDALDELTKAGMYPEAGDPFTPDEPRGILFTQRSARPIRID